LGKGGGVVGSNWSERLESDAGPVSSNKESFFIIICELHVFPMLCQQAKQQDVISEEAMIE
jgi:hypothetical protein